MALEFTPFAVATSEQLKSLIKALQRQHSSENKGKSGATEGEPRLDQLLDQDTLSLRDLRFLQELVKAAKATDGINSQRNTTSNKDQHQTSSIPWLHEVIHTPLLHFPQVKSKLSPKEVEEQNERRKVLQARAAERQYQSMVEPLYRRATNAKRRQIYEQKLQYQLGVPMNMIAAAGTAFLIGYYGGMHYFNDHSSALGVGCVLLFIMLFVEMMLFTIRSI